MIRILLLTAIVFSSFIYAQAQKHLKVNNSNGTTDSYELTKINKITFSDVISATPENMAKLSKLIFQLKAFPNPANESLTVEYSLEAKSEVTIQLFDNNGHLVKQEGLRQQPIGINQYQWNLTDKTGSRVDNGIYHCRVLFNNQVLTEKLLIVK